MGLHPPATPGSPRQWWQRRVKLRWGRRHFAPGRSKKKTTVLFYDMMGPCWQQWYKHKTIIHTYPCLSFMIYRILENWKKWDRHDSLHTKVCSPNRLLMMVSHKAIFIWWSLTQPEAFSVYVGRNLPTQQLLSSAVGLAWLCDDMQVIKRYHFLNGA